MGMTVGNCAVKAPKAAVIPLLPDTPLYLAVDGDFTYLFPLEEDFGSLSELATNLSAELNTNALCGEVYDSDSVHVAFFKQGKKLYEYEWYEQPEPEINGEIEAVFEAFNFTGDKQAYLSMLKEKESFAETKYEKMIEPLGISFELRQLGYNYIFGYKVDETHEDTKLNIEKIKGLYHAI